MWVLEVLVVRKEKEKSIARSTNSATNATARQHHGNITQDFVVDKKGDCWLYPHIHMLLAAIELLA